MDTYSFRSKNFDFHTSKREIRDILIAWIIVSIAFSIIRGYENIVTNIIISAITVGIAFFLHEMAHKIVAQKYKCWAEFRADYRMLFAGLLMSFLGFVFIAPGAVIIFGHINKKQNGIISMWGPLTNIILSLILLPLMYIYTTGISGQIIEFGYMINSWLALFNMIPIGNFDGIKILHWNKKVYFGILIMSIILLMMYFMR